MVNGRQPPPPRGCSAVLVSIPRDWTRIISSWLIVSVLVGVPVSLLAWELATSADSVKSNLILFVSCATLAVLICIGAMDRPILAGADWISTDRGRSVVRLDQLRVVRKAGFGMARNRYRLSDGRAWAQMDYEQLRENALLRRIVCGAVLDAHGKDELRDPHLLVGDFALLSRRFGRPR